jgi:hypothetical protein
VKILKKKNEDDVQIRPSQQEVFSAEAHPPPSVQYTRVVQGTTKYKVRKYVGTSSNPTKVVGPDSTGKYR